MGITRVKGTPRIEARISMQRAATLTTKIEVRNTFDISRKNDVFNVPQLRGIDFPQVAGYCMFIQYTDRVKSRILILNEIFDLIQKKYSNLVFWLVASNSSWQNDTRVVRYKKFLKGFPKRGIGIQHALDFNEYVIEKQGQIKFVAAVKLSMLSIDSVAIIMEEEKNSYLIALDKDDPVENIVKHGWDSSSFIDLELLMSVVETRGILIKAIGEFDDIDNGFALLGEQKIIKELSTVG